MSRRPLALLLSVFLAASGTAGVALHVCQSMGGIAVGGCDCERPLAHAGHGDHGSHAHETPGPKLERQPCCSVELTEASAVVATHEAPTLRIDEASVAIVGLGPSPISHARSGCDDPGLLRERAPPNIHGPPLFVRHCSLLN